MFKGYDKLFEEVVGTLQLTIKEQQQYKSSLKNSIKMWRIKGLLKKDELPDKNHELVWEWKVQQDKKMINQLSLSLESRVKNYRRKVFGLKQSLPTGLYIRWKMQELLKEGFQILYPNWENIEQFFTDKKPK
jgi:hypothetical protein